MLGSTEPNMPGFDETQALDEEGKAAVGFLQVDEDEEGKAAVGFLQVDEDEEGIGARFEGAGFDFKPSRHWVPFRTQQPLGQWIC
ncbi:hypothetical protein SLEP1_g10592 [Rubroshorea leprosula]|uniref:Uncharacterized protein n=1 Tax=Rubroshorea leprosula TaxID=152421 RepID=A0AAV5I8J4_9ROSI|nr:hypothetical protein SLEP1_g10592 [Rubroshorea leprosula]